MVYLFHIMIMIILKKYPKYNVQHDQFWDRFQNYSVPIILTDQFKLANINDCFANPDMVSIPESLENKPRIVHSSIYDNMSFQNFLRKLNEERFYYRPPSKKVIETLTEDEIKTEYLRKSLIILMKKIGLNTKNQKKLTK